MIFVFRALFIVVAAFMAACTPLSGNTYTGNTKPDSDIAIIKRSPDSTEFPPFFVSYSRTMIPGSVRVYGALELKMEPASYIIVVEFNNIKTNIPLTLPMRVSAGITYEISCKRRNPDSNQLLVSVSSAYYTAENDSPVAPSEN